MVERKKIIFIGPAGSGKTTLKRVFFDMANPFYLLRTPLEPTRGINSRLYSLFNVKIGMFDLAGQENQDWYNKDKNIFSGANIIICVIDINSYLKEIFEFFNDFFEIYRDLKLYDCYTLILLHKIDLIDPLYLQHKLKAINEFLEKESIEKINLAIHTTSIAEDYFFKTYDLFTEIFTEIFKHKIITMDKSIFQNFKIDLKIIMKYSDSSNYRMINLYRDFDLPFEEAKLHIKRLEYLGFIKFIENTQDFQFTKRSTFFKSGLEKIDEKESKINRILESLFIFSNLNQGNE